MNSARRLAAIFFADIAGYTAMMQKDEEKAMLILNQYTNVLSDYVTRYDGEIVKQYGDGSLVLFSSAIHAVNCSIEIQKIFRQEPVVPLRIGIHVGEVFKREDDYFGNDINIASRVESMGVTGSILITKEVKDKLNNQTRIDSQSLGDYLFKNIDEPIEVFALSNEGLIIPDKKMVQGKFAKRKTVWQKYGFVIIGLLLISLIGAWFTSQKMTALNDTDSSVSMLNKRVAIVPFTNESEDPSVNVISKMASDWITQIILTNRAGKVVNLSKHVLNDLDNSLSDFISEAGIDILIDGGYYTLNDGITISTNIKNPSANETISKLSSSGLKSDPISILNDVQDKLMGYWFLGGEEWIGTNPPKFSAYEKFLELDETWITDFKKSEQTLNEVLALDSTFYRAYMSLVVLYSNESLYQQADSLINYIKDKQFPLSDFEKLRLNSVSAYIEGDINQTASLSDEIFVKYGQQEIDALQYNLRNNNPSRVIELVAEFNTLTELSDSYSGQNKFAAIVESYFRLGQYDKAITSIEPVKEKVINADIAITHLRSLVYKKNTEEIQSTLDFYSHQKLEWFGIYNLNLLHWAICQEAFLSDKTDVLKVYALKMNEYARLNPTDITFEQDMYTSNIFLNRLDSAEHYAEKWGKKFGGFYKPDFIAVSALNGNLSLANQYLQNDVPESFAFDRGDSDYNRAKILTVLGRHDEAVQLLQSAINKGQYFLWYNFNNDIFFKDLLSNSSFQELVKLKN